MRSIGMLVSLSLMASCTRSPQTSSTSDITITSKTLKCASASDELVYYGDESQILVTADISQPNTLVDLSIDMRENDNLGASGETIPADPNYSPRSPLYSNHDRYTSAGDAWCIYHAIIPKDVRQRTRSFSMYLQQICEAGWTSTATLSCKVETTTRVLSPAEEADVYAELIEDAQYMSESDSTWEAFHSAATVGRRLPLAEIAVALGANNLPIATYSNRDAMKILAEYADPAKNPYRDAAEAAKYKRLKEALEANFSSIRMYKVGVPDSGQLKLYLVGRTKSGHLVGLKTIVVET
jgi:hypothetical protein